MTTALDRLAADPTPARATPGEVFLLLSTAAGGVTLSGVLISGGRVFVQNDLLRATISGALTAGSGVAAARTTRLRPFFVSASGVLALSTVTDLWLMLRT